MKTIAIITGGDSAESVISIQSANVVKNNINKDKFLAIIVTIKESKWEAVIENRRINIDKADFSFEDKRKRYHFDLVFMALHGPPAENGELQLYFDKIGLPYTSSGAKESSITFNKYECNNILKNLGFLCAESYLYKRGDSLDVDEIIKKVGLPCFVKPNSAGSSLGISKVTEKAKLEDSIMLALKYDNKIIIETYINGTEVSCGIFKHSKVEVLPITEIISYNEFFDYEAKYKGNAHEITPARISLDNTKLIKEITKNAYKKLNLKGIVRIDFIIIDNKPYIIEINTIPGLSEESIIPKQAIEAGYSLSELFELTIENTINK
jgi:D-alanine-D-alanine ligase